jgi:uncharacterized damage-inducible protein DinB
MTKLLRDLVAHKGHANRLMLDAIAQHQGARDDEAILALLHHILVANRFWFLTSVGEPFVREREMLPPASFDALVESYANLQEREETWIGGLSEADLERVLETPHIPGGSCTVAEGVTQVCLHTQGHRSQIAKMLRALGGTPPMTDFILWVTQRPSGVTV